jgi:hypothetical protein
MPQTKKPTLAGSASECLFWAGITISPHERRFTKWLIDVGGCELTELRETGAALRFRDLRAARVQIYSGDKFALLSFGRMARLATRSEKAATLRAMMAEKLKNP